MESTVSPIPQKAIHSTILNAYTSTSLDELVNNCFLAHLGLLTDPRKLDLINKFINHLIKLHCHENLQFLIDIYIYEYYYGKYIAEGNDLEQDIATGNTNELNDDTNEDLYGFSSFGSSRLSVNLTNSTTPLGKFDQECIDSRINDKIDEGGNKDQEQVVEKDDDKLEIDMNALAIAGGDRIDDEINNIIGKNVINCDKDCVAGCIKQVDWKDNNPDTNLDDCFIDSKSIYQYKQKLPTDSQDFQFDNTFNSYNSYDLELGHDKNILVNQWNLIINNYIINDSPNQINLSQYQYKSLLMENKLAKIHHPKCLLKSRNEILQLLRENAYTSFKEKSGMSSPITSSTSPVSSVASPFRMASPNYNRSSPTSLFDGKLPKKPVDILPKSASTQISPVISSIDYDYKHNLSSFKQKLHKKFGYTPPNTSSPSSSTSSSLHLANLFGHLKTGSSISPTPDELKDCQEDCKQHSTSQHLKFWSKRKN